MSDNDDDDHNHDNNNNGVSINNVYDPERNERINRIMQANRDSAYDVFKDDQVTDFVLRMAEKNQKMADNANVNASTQNYIHGGNNNNSNKMYNNGDELEFDDDDDDDELNESSHNNSMKQRHRELQQRVQNSRRQHRSPDDYPPGEAYAGDEVGEETEIPSFDPKDDSVFSYGRFCCVMIAIFILLIAASILILLFVVLLDKEGSSNHDVILPLAPTNLVDLCAPERLGYMQGELSCRDPCMKAACCWEQGPNGETPACYHLHPRECAAYDSCTNLLTTGSDPRPFDDSSSTGSGTSSVPRAPDSVARCDPMVVDSVDDLLACEEACNFGTCCWKTGARVCAADPNCLDYKPCEILNIGSSSTPGNSNNNFPTSAPVAIPEAPDDLKEVCTGASFSEKCQDYCLEATCCWKMAVSTFTGKDGGAVTESVLGECSSRSECTAYKPCQTLNWVSSSTSSSAATTHNVPDAPGNLADLCNAGTGEVNEYEQCVETCHSAACCWKTSITSYSGANGETITETIAGTCSFLEKCSGYEPCKILAGATSVLVEGTSTVAPASSIPKPPSNLDQICTEQSMDTCRALCNEAICCWKLAANTHTDDQGELVTEAVRGSCAAHEECVAYDPCSELPEASNSGHTLVGDAPDSLDTICNPPADQMDSIETCVEFCNEATCCWKTAKTSYKDANNRTVTTTVTGTCSHKPECEPYRACSTLEEDATSPSTLVTSPAPAPTGGISAPTQIGGSAELSESMIYGACFNHVDQPNVEKTMCEVVCEPGSCCYQPDQDCAAGFDCIKYEPCQKLAQEVDGTDAERTAVESACQNIADLADCVELCSDVTCCFTQDLQKACDVTRPGTECSDFIACEVLYENGNSN